MPLPIPIHFHDADGKEKPVLVKQKGEAAPAPTTEYHPTMVIVRCSKCKMDGIVEFVGGFNLTDGDRLMDGKPINGFCFKCQKETELVPITLPKEEDRRLRTLYDIRASLQEAVKRGERLGPRGMIWPLARVKAYDDWKRSQET